MPGSCGGCIIGLTHDRPFQNLSLLLHESSYSVTHQRRECNYIRGLEAIMYEGATGMRNTGDHCPSPLPPLIINVLASRMRKSLFQLAICLRIIASVCPPLFTINIPIISLIFNILFFHCYFNLIEDRDNFLSFHF